MTATPRNPAARAPQNPQPLTHSSSEDAFHVPPIADEAAPDGPDVSDQPGQEVGHYGPGYGDPTRHEGGDPPGKGTPLEKTLQPLSPEQGGQQ